MNDQGNTEDGRIHKKIDKNEHDEGINLSNNCKSWDNLEYLMTVKLI